VGRIENSSFYNCIINGVYFCSTNSERPEKGRPLTARPANDFSAVHVWRASAAGPAQQLLSFPVDVWFKLSGLRGVPPGLFQYSNVFFPEGENLSGHLVCAPKGTREYDNCTLVYDLADWPGLT
jgi:hypothetical protein